MLLFLFSASFILSIAVVPLLIGMLERAGHLAVNYQGRRIPTSLGIAFVLVGTPISFVALASGQVSLMSILWPSFLIMSIALVGLIDDAFGSRDVRGLKGHLGSLFGGRGLSTGALKAIFGCLVSFISAFSVNPTPGSLILNGSLIALLINFVNLLDLRPGRAAKVYIAGLLSLLILASGWDRLYYLFPLTGGVVAYLPWELSARAMMGDVGSNVLGAALGYGFAVATSMPVKLVALAFLILIHVVAERWSLTELIERVPILRFLDRLGRG